MLRDNRDVTTEVLFCKSNVYLYYKYLY